MAKFIVKSLRDGCLEGDHAPSLAIIDSLHSPLGSHAFRYFLFSFVSLVQNESSQARGIVLVAFYRSPDYYIEGLRSIGFDASMLEKWVRILDCYSDPLGWKSKNSESEISKIITVLNNVKDVDGIFKSILDLTTGSGGDSKTRFAVAFDSVNNMLRHSSLRSVSSLLINLRSHERISCLFYLMHSDLHEPKFTASLEYISTMIATLENQNSDNNNILFMEQNYSKANFNARLKKRNGRVKLLCEEMCIEQNGVKFNPIITDINTVVTQTIIPKVQFNLQLSEKEKLDRANVVLPFEHQGKGENIQIYDGRKSLSDNQINVHNNNNKNTNNSEKGEIHYLRDSDDERPDSDEDPDDDLDI
ncbi:hypothetical protein LUZ60_015326 [Juncus effusus]|nr:hypothetical protein LUZ60_015326 [Juncus effusus]